MAVRLPGPLHPANHLARTGLDGIFPFYHAVTDQALLHTRHLYPLRSKARFEADLEVLLKYFEPVSMADFLSGEVPGNARKIPMVLSFDDGLVQCHQETMPILLKKGLPATFFLNNDFIDNRDLFFRFKVSLLLELLPGKSGTEKTQAATLLQCRVPDLKNRLLGLSYPERDLLDTLAGAWSYSFREYLEKQPVYLSSSQVSDMIREGFEIGSHGFDHPQFSLLSQNETIHHIRWSTEDLQTRFGMSYRYFAFPFTDDGVQDDTIGKLFSGGIIDAGFGTAGLKDDRWPAYRQRVPMEWSGLDARRILRGELNRRRGRLLIKNNLVDRGNPPRA